MNLCLRAVRANKSFRIVCNVLYCIVFSCNLLPDHPGPTGQLCQPGHRRDCTAIAENSDRATAVAMFYEGGVEQRFTKQ